MKEVRCPKCDSVFEIDASGYADIVKQIRGEEFENELNHRLKDLESNHNMKIELSRQSIATEKDKEILKLKNQIDNHSRELEIAKNDAKTDIKEELFAKEKQVERLQNERKAAATNTCLLYTSPSPRDGLLSRMPSSA